MLEMFKEYLAVLCASLSFLSSCSYNSCIIKPYNEVEFIYYFSNIKDLEVLKAEMKKRPFDLKRGPKQGLNPFFL